LHLTHAKMRTLYGRTNMNSVSRFIREIPESLLLGWTEEEDDAIFGIPNQNKPHPRLESSKPTRRAQKVTTGAENETWQVGDKANHKKWGVGTIVKVNGSGDSMEIDVAFPHPTGIKRLLAKFAPITKV